MKMNKYEEICRILFLIILMKLICNQSQYNQYNKIYTMTIDSLFPFNHYFGHPIVLYSLNKKILQNFIIIRYFV